MSVFQIQHVMNGKIAKFALKNEDMESKDARRLLGNLFFNKYGYDPTITRIKGGGSAREYFRLCCEGNNVIGAYCTDYQENECFCSLDRILEKNKIKVPFIISVSENKQAYIMEDLGDVSLLDMLPTDKKDVLTKKAIKQLVKFQNIPEREWGDKVRYSELSQRLVKWDLNYFKYMLLKSASIDFNEDKLEDDFERLQRVLVDYPVELQGLMYRDFQSRNIMVKGEEVYFIDFQGARKGNVLYDIVSFLWQAKAPYTPEERKFYLDYYATLQASFREISESLIKEGIWVWVLFRTLQVLGAYGLRGLIERKQHFVESIPLAINNLIDLKKYGVIDDYPEIIKILKSLEQKFLKSRTLNEKLTITIGSFSYKNGYPEDESGNGGGFIFDCRGLPNPGRYEEYKRSTGMDPDVEYFLNSKNEVREFIKQSGELVSISIDNYLQRKFNSLQVWFGCTGGQHRSVYCAESLSKILKEKYKEELILSVVHREQKINKIL